MHTERSHTLNILWSVSPFWWIIDTSKLTQHALKISVKVFKVLKLETIWKQNNLREICQVTAPVIAHLANSH